MLYKWGISLTSQILHLFQCKVDIKMCILRSRHQGFSLKLPFSLSDTSKSFVSNILYITQGQSADLDSLT